MFRCSTGRPEEISSIVRVVGSLDSSSRSSAVLLADGGAHVILQVDFSASWDEP